MILYIGNFLERHGANPGFNRLLVAKFRQYFEVRFSSEKANRPGRLMDMLSAVWRLRKKTRVVVVDVFSTEAFWFAYATARLCRLLHLPYITILHGGNLPERLKQSPTRCLAVFNYSAANVSPSIFLKNVFEAHGHRAVYIPNFIDIAQYPFRARETVRPRLLWVRSFHKVYNPILAVEVLAQLQRTHRDAVLCMVGPDKDGSVADVMQRAKELSVTNHLTITGRMSRQEWTQLAGDYDIFLNTTNVDNHPVSVIEAMALGLPLVSTNVGGLPYLIEAGQDGLLVPPGDAAAFVTAINGLLEQPGLAVRLAAKARRKVENLDWNHLKDEWLRLLGSAMRPAA